MQFEFNVTTQVIVTAVSALIAAGALFLAWRQARERQLRKDDVLKWSSETIRTLQTLYLICFLGEGTFDRKTIKERLAALAIDTSVLVEQGRLFFRNSPDPTYGADRHPAYRGWRPELLDPIVVAHEIACRWDEATGDEHLQMILVAEDCVKRFVSMAQREVGRSKTAAADSARRGDGERLEALLGKIGPERIEALRQKPRVSL
jgi:hypothetical protein